MNSFTKHSHLNFRINVNDDGIQQLLVLIKKARAIMKEAGSSEIVAATTTNNTERFLIDWDELC